MLHAQGLPLYVRFVIEDIVSGHFHFHDLAQKLPPSLSGYFDDLVRRLGIGDLQVLLTPLVVTITWALAPLDEQALLWLMVKRKQLNDDEEGRKLLRRGLDSIRSMIRLAPAVNGGFGYEPYHHTFREYIQADAAGNLKQQNSQAKNQFCRLTIDWAEVPADHPVLRYTLQFGPQHLHEARCWGDLYVLARSEAFLQAQSAVLTQDPDAPLRTLRLALQGAMEQDDAPKMGELVITHARRLQATTQETPLSALRNGSLERAWKLADLYETEKRVLWYLLLAWELKDTERETNRKDTFARLEAASLPELTSQWVSLLLLQAASPDEDVFAVLSQKIIDRDRHYADVITNLASQGDIMKANRFVAFVQDKQQRARVFQAIISAQIAVADFDAALITGELLGEIASGEALNAFLEIAKSAGRAANKKAAGQALRQATYIAPKFVDEDSANEDEQDVRWRHWLIYGKVVRTTYDAGYSSMSRVGFLTDAARKMFEDSPTIESAKDYFYISAYELAYDKAGELTEPSSRVSALVQIAQTDAQGRKDKHRGEGFNKALQSVNDLEEADGWINGLNKIATAQIEVGLINDAMNTLAELDADWCSPLHKFDHSLLGAMFNLKMEVITALSSAGQHTAAVEAALTDGGPLLVFALSEKAVALARSGLLEESNVTFHQACRLAIDIWVKVYRYEVDPQDTGLAWDLVKWTQSLGRKKLQSLIRLIKVSQAQICSMYGKGARDTFAEVLQMLHQEETRPYDNSFLSEWGELLCADAKVEDYEGSSSLARNILLPLKSDTSDIGGLSTLLKAQVALGLLTDAAVTAGNLHEVMDLPRSEEEENEYSDYWEDINEGFSVLAHAQIYSGDLTAAHETNQMTPGYPWGGSTPIAEAYALQGKFEEAEAALEEDYVDTDESDKIRREVALLQAQAKSPAKEAQLQIEYGKNDNDIDRQLLALWKWAEFITDERETFATAMQDVLKEGGISRKALYIFAEEAMRVSDLCETSRGLIIRFAVAKHRVKALSCIAQVCWANGDRQRAEQLLASAEASAKRFTNESKKIASLHYIALAQITCQQSEKSIETVQQLVKESTTEAIFEVALIEIADRFANVQDNSNFKHLLTHFVRSLPLAAKIWGWLIKLYPDQNERLTQAILEQVHPYVTEK